MSSSAGAWLVAAACCAQLSCLPTAADGDGGTPQPAQPPRRCANTTGTAPLTGVSVKVVREQLLFTYAESMGGSGGQVIAFRNGDLQATIGSPTDASRAKRSSDSGASWRAMPVNATTNRSVSNFGSTAYEYEDSGEVIQFTGHDADGAAKFPLVPDPSDRRWATTRAELIRSTDHGLTEQSFLAELTLPVNLSLTCAGHGGIVRVDDGGLLAAPYGVARDGVGKDRVFALHSTNRGRSWRYRSTVAFDLSGSRDIDMRTNPNHSPHPYGFDGEHARLPRFLSSARLRFHPMIACGAEATLVHVAGSAGKPGFTTCIMRTGDSYAHSFGNGKLYRAISPDSGT